MSNNKNAYGSRKRPFSETINNLKAGTESLDI